MKRQKTFRDETLLNLSDTTFQLLTVAILSVVIIAGHLLLPDLTQKAKEAVAGKIAAISYEVATPFRALSSYINTATNLTQLQARNKALEAENIRLKEWYQTALMLEAENKSLGKLLNIQNDENYSFVTARLLTDLSGPFGKKAFIRSENSTPLSKNLAVLSGEGLIGRTQTQSGDISRVLLLTDSESRVPILIEGTNRKAILTGNNTEYPTLSFLAKDANLSEGERIITSGDGGVFPPNLPVGRLFKQTDGMWAVRLFGVVEETRYIRVMKPISN